MYNAEYPESDLKKTEVGHKSSSFPIKNVVIRYPTLYGLKLT